LAGKGSLILGLIIWASHSAPWKKEHSVRLLRARYSLGLFASLRVWSLCAHPTYPSRRDFASLKEIPIHLLFVRL